MEIKFFIYKVHYFHIFAFKIDPSEALIKSILCTKTQKVVYRRYKWWESVLKVYFMLCVGRIKCYKNSAVGCLNSSTINNLSIYEYIHRFT